MVSHNMELHYLITFLVRQEEKRGLHTYLVPNKEKAREVDGRVGNWAAFYTGPSSLHVQWHC